MAESKKFINIKYSYYRKLLRDSYRLTTLKGLIKKCHNILKRTDETDKGREDINKET